jgi:two-component system, OmpR family, phosphate regulon response regulator OmpR
MLPWAPLASPYSSWSEVLPLAMSRAHTIWVVDDDPELRQLLGTHLTDQGYEVRCLNDGRQLMARLEFQRPDLLVLDLMLPGDDGLTLLRRLRDGSDDLPVVMLTARAEAVDRIIGLEQGADDYLAKPFLPRELTARIEAVLRRRGNLPAGTPLADGEVIRFGANALDLSARTLEREGQPVTITSGEFSLLAAFVQHPHRPLSRERLIELARGPASETDSRSMDVQVSRVRRLIEPDSSRPRYLQTVWGYGYVFVPDGSQRSR